MNTFLQILILQGSLPKKHWPYQEELHYIRGVVANLNELAEAIRFLGNYPLALKLNFEACK
jgi:hypothetical protein